MPVPTLAMSGERDGCIASDVFEQLMVAQDFPKGLTFSRIAEAGHFPHQEQPGQVNREIADWLKLNDARSATQQ